MDQLQQNFERDFRIKLKQNLKGNVSEESFLLKIFKFMDLSNTGNVNKQQFIQAICKVGIVIPSQEDDIFSLYAGSNSTIPYRPFIQNILYAVAQLPQSEKVQRTITRGQALQQQQQQDTIIDKEKIKKTIQKLQEMLQKKQGDQNPLLKLLNEFQEKDMRGQGYVAYEQFTHILEHQQYHFSQLELQLLFDYFDQEKRRMINYTEFIKEIKGELSPLRFQLLQDLFQKIDLNQQNIISFNQMSQLFCANRHPYVHNRYYTEDQVANEMLFIYSLYAKCFSLYGGKLNEQQFIDMYSYYSFMIANENLFQQIMKAVWRGNELIKPSNNNLDKQSQMEEFSMQSYYGQSGQSGRDMESRSQAPSEISYQEPSLLKTEQPKQLVQKFQNIINNNINNKMKRQLDGILLRIKTAIRMKGILGFFTLYNICKNLDFDNDLEINSSEFKKAMRDMRIDIAPFESEQIFKFLSQEKHQINYANLINILIGPLDNHRAELVEEIFSLIDKDSDEIITIPEVKDFFNPRHHPDVKSNKKTEEEVINELVRALQMHKQILKTEQYIDITKQEFFDFFRYYSAIIENDYLFESLCYGPFKLGQNTAKHEQNYAGLTSYQTKFVKFFIAGLANYQNAQAQYLKQNFQGQNEQYNQEKSNQQSKSKNLIWDDENAKFETNTSAFSTTNNQYQDSKTPPLMLQKYQEQSRPQYQQQFHQKYHQAPFGVDNSACQFTKQQQNYQRSQQFQQSDDYQKQYQQRFQQMQIQEHLQQSYSPQTMEIIEMIRDRLCNWGVNGIFLFLKFISQFDSKGQFTIPKQYFAQLLTQDFRMQLSNQALNFLINSFANPLNPLEINYLSFLRALCPNLSPARKQIVQTAYRNVSQKCQQGKVCLIDLYNNFIPENHPFVKARKMTSEEVAMQFDEGFELILKVLKERKSDLRNEIVTSEEFEEYYRLFGMALADDLLFEQIVTGVWGIQSR